MADKSKSVMAAIKGRKGVVPKKGSVLVGIMAKLTAKRESAKEDKGETAEGSKEPVKDGKGGFAGDAVEAGSSLVRKLYGKAKKGVQKVSDVILGPQENYLKAQDAKDAENRRKAMDPSNFH